MSPAFSLLDSRRDLCQHTPALMIPRFDAGTLSCLGGLPAPGGFICGARQTQHDAKSTAEEYRS